MDDHRFDTLVRALAAGIARRGLLRWLTPVVLGGLPWRVANDDAAGQGRRKRRKKRHKHGRGRHRHKRHKPHKPHNKPHAQQCECPDPKKLCPGGCPEGWVCQVGDCVPCDVCPKGCTYGRVSSLLFWEPDQSFIRICPGTYQETNWSILKKLTLQGTGSAEDGGTIIRGRLQVYSSAVASLIDLRITGGDAFFSEGGGGIFNRGDLRMSGVVVTDNRSPSVGGGIFNNRGNVLLGHDCRVTGNTAHDDGGGIFNFFGTAYAYNSDVITDNTPNNCGGPTPVTNCVNP